MHAEERPAGPGAALLRAASDGAGHDGRRGARLDTLWFLLGSLLVYGLLRQHTFYATDAHGFLFGSLKGDLVHPYHFAYLPLLAASREVAHWFGGTIYDAGTWLSAFGTAAGVAAAHAACLLLGLRRAEAALAAALVATAPAIVFFATVVEIHGPHFGLCGATFVATAWFAVRPNWQRGAWLGAATGLGYLGHATGALLPAMALPVAAVLAVQRGAARRQVIAALGPAPFVHALIVVGVPPLLRFHGQEQAPGAAVQFLEGQLLGAGDLLTVLLPWRTAWNDWLCPFVPLAALALAALAPRRSRALALALLPALAVYVVVTVLLMGPGSEHGAYLLPLAWPAALAAVAALPRPRALVPLLAVAMAVAVGEVRAHDRGEDRAFADGYREVIGGRRAFVLGGTHREVAAFLLWLPDALWDQPFALLGTQAETVAAGLPGIDAWLQATTAAGTEVWITAGAVAMLGDPEWTKGRPAGPLLLEHLRRVCVWKEHRAGTFTAWRLEAK